MYVCMYLCVYVYMYVCMQEVYSILLCLSPGLSLPLSLLPHSSLSPSLPPSHSLSLSLSIYIYIYIYICTYLCTFTSASYPSIMSISPTYTRVQCLRWICHSILILHTRTHTSFHFDNLRPHIHPSRQFHQRAGLFLLLRLACTCTQPSPYDTTLLLLLPSTAISGAVLCAPLIFRLAHSCV
jgi:hypothetical protein